MIIASCRYRFSASHRLHTSRLDERRNAELYGKCNNPFGHGHDYVLEVLFSGPIDPETGLLLRLADLHQLVQQEVISEFDHASFNTDIEEFTTMVPTTENIARVVADRLGRKWSVCFSNSKAVLAGIRIEETDRNSFEVVLCQPSSMPSVRQENEFVHA